MSYLSGYGVHAYLTAQLLQINAPLNDICLADAVHLTAWIPAVPQYYQERTRRTFPERTAAGRAEDPG
jgi:hypothetical protein